MDKDTLILQQIVYNQINLFKTALQIKQINIVYKKMDYKKMLIKH